MTNDSNKPGADAPGEKKNFVPPAEEQEAAQAALVPVAIHAHRAAASPRRRQAGGVVDPALDGGASGTDASHLAARLGRRQAEAVVDPTLDDTSGRSTTRSLIAVLPPEAVVRLVLFAGRMARKQGKHLPQNIAERLSEALARGDATAPALRDWAIRIGVLPQGCGSSPAACTEDHEAALLAVAPTTESDRATMRAVALARYLRERLGMRKPSLLARAEQKASLGSRPTTLSDSGDASPIISDDPRRRS